MGSSAAATLAGLPELLRCLVDQIQCSRYLATLRLVSRNFNDAATPALFRAAAPSSAEPIAALAGSSLVLYVRDLTIPYVDRKWAPAANSALQELLEKIPLLESFSCSCPMLPETISILHRSCPRLKSLPFDFERMDDSVLDLRNDQPEDQDLRARQLFTIPDLTVFGDLDKLSLLNLYGDLPQWRNQVVQVLKNSPNLKSLGLSLSADALSRHYFFAHEIEQYRGWFNSLCKSYIETGGLHLPLRSLFCGTAVFPENSAHLEQLIDLSSLEEVHIENENVWDDHSSSQVIILYDAATHESGIVFDFFVNAPNLRRLKVANYAVDVHQAFRSMKDPARARQIAISAQKSGEGHEPAAVLRPDNRYPALPIHPRMLEMDLDRTHCDFYMLGEDGEEMYDLPPADELLDSLVNGDEGILEGLVLYLPDANYPDDDEPPTLDEQYELLERTLPQLTNLTQLCIRGHGYDVDGYTDVAQRLALAIPSLRYINVRMCKHFKDKNYRRIVRNDRGVTLVELESRTENEEVELYRMLLYERMPVYGL